MQSVYTRMTTMSKLKRKKLSVEESRFEQHSRIKKSNDRLCTVQDSSCSKTSTGRERWWESSELNDAERLWALTLRALCPALQSDQEESIPQLPPPSSTKTLVQKVSDWRWCSANEDADPPPDLPAPSFLTHSPPVNDCKNPSQPPAAKNMGESDSPALAGQKNYTSSPDQESGSVCDIQTAQQCRLEDKVNCVEGSELSDKHGDKFGQAGKVSEIQELTRGSKAGLDAESRAGIDARSRARGSEAGLELGSRAGIDARSRAGGSGARLEAGSRAGIDARSRAGGSGAGLEAGSRAGIDARSRAGGSGAGLNTGSRAGSRAGIDARAGGSGAGLDTGSRAGIDARAGGSGGGLDAGSREGGSGAGLDAGSRAGLDTGSRAGGSGAGKGTKTGAGGYGSRLGTIPGTGGFVSVMSTKQGAGVSGLGQRAKSGAGGSGAGGSGTGQLAISGVRGSELGLGTKSGAGQGAKSGLKGSGSELGRNSGAGGPGLGQGTKSGPEGSGTPSGSGLDCCPMCLIPFSEGFTQMECDGHLAQCLSEMHDDIIW
ncbi:uncharacterized protein LOC143732121 isoform X1 [Siphateles boraxobius]|uniref:uncharacterized protein LOC143732121 isoform X1 n=1 Tax=Siphateles boraxobius TaxID=180520 RepID=UPI004063C948